MMSAKLCIIFSLVIYYSARVKCVNTDIYGTEPNIGSALLQLGKKMKHPLLQLLAKAFDSLEYRIEKLEKFSQDINIKSQMTETDGRGVSCADDYDQDSFQSGGLCKDLRPELAVSPMKAGEPEGSTVVYKCQVKSGEGPLNVVWSRQDKRLLPDRATVSPKYSLTIRNLKRDDTGRYSCSATNRYGVTRQEVELIVIAVERPEITIIVRQTKYVSIVGETARLECYTEDETGRVTLFWSRSSGLPYGSSQDNGILTIPNVQPSYAGNYVCTGTDRESDRVGTAVAVLDVQIEEGKLDKQTCQEGAGQCHSDAVCIDYTDGFCCSCVSPAFGNGKHCVETTNPRRINGIVSGRLNGVSFDQLDMHSFVPSKKGRVYTAISSVPDEISSEMITLNTICGVIGWMYALKRGPGARNGFMFTGGDLNRTARIRYQNGEEVVIEQKYIYHETSVAREIEMETVINGYVPKLKYGEKINIDDNSEVYRRVSPGVIRSSSEHMFNVNNVASRFTLDQEINFEECAFDPLKDKKDSQRLSVTRTSAFYQPNDKVVRFAMSYRIQKRKLKGHEVQKIKTPKT